MDKGISHVLSMSILLYGLRRPIFNSQDKEPYSFVELKAQEKTGLLLMPTAKVTKNVSAAEGGGNVLCSILISIKTKAWLYSFDRPQPLQQIEEVVPVVDAEQELFSGLLDLPEESGGFPVGGILEKAAAGNDGKIFLERTVHQAVRCFIGTFSPTVPVMAVPQAFQGMGHICPCLPAVIPVDKVAQENRCFAVH